MKKEKDERPQITRVYLFDDREPDEGGKYVTLLREMMQLFFKNSEIGDSYEISDKLSVTLFSFLKDTGAAYFISSENEKEQKNDWNDNLESLFQTNTKENTITLLLCDYKWEKENAESLRDTLIEKALARENLLLAMYSSVQSDACQRYVDDLLARADRKCKIITKSISMRKHYKDKVKSIEEAILDDWYAE